MTKLTDMQLVLLSTAATREDGSLLPPPDSLGTRFDRIRRSVETLITKGLACEFVVAEQSRSWRHEDSVFYGVMINDAGRAALDDGNGAGASDAPTIGGSKTGSSQPDSPPAEGQPTSTVATPRADSKAAKVIGLLQRDGGASLAEIVELTGWLPHTSRAALTGLRKKGHPIVNGKVEGLTRYTIATAA